MERLLDFLERMTEERREEYAAKLAARYPLQEDIMVLYNEKKQRAEEGLPGLHDYIGEIFAEIDADHDGFITREEVLASLRSRSAAADEAVCNEIFIRMDSNGDGRISKDEMIAYADAGVAAWFAMLDKARDDEVARREAAGQ